jgi:tetratricopeptide (TPR) repeat protein
MNRQKRRAAAKSAKIKSNPSAATPDALCDLGFALLKSGHVTEADRCCRQALTLQPNFADGLHLMGVIAVSQRQHDQAIEWFAGALRQTPKPHYLLSLGNALQLAERLDEALKAYDRGVSLKPEDAELWNSMGFVLSKLDRTDEAILALQHALKLSPRHLQAAQNCATLLFESKRFDEAVVYYDLCAEIEPDRVDIYLARGGCHSRRLQFQLALADYERALKLDPDHADTHYRIGHAHLNCGRYEAALHSFDRALALTPDRAPFLASKGLAAAEQHLFAEAFAAYDRALAVAPDNALAQWNLALLNMLMGNFAPGWAGREARWRVAELGMAPRTFVEPLWLGQEPIAGRTILLHGDEGLGDQIQFSRYVPMVAALGARVILEVSRAVYPLLSGIPRVAQSLPRDSALPEFDFHCPLASLPLAFQTRVETVPAPISCLPLIPEILREQWESWLGPHDRFRVGLVWSGSTIHKNDRNRSTTLQMLSPLLDLDATFVSLQKEPREQDRITLQGRADVMDAKERLTDFLATAALVSCLDLVITVDTSVAHLAGTLGCPVWIMLPFTPDYRWLLDRDDSPWYPTARLFRQTATRDYTPLVERMKDELQRLVATWQSTSGRTITSGEPVCAQAVSKQEQPKAPAL